MSANLVYSFESIAPGQTVSVFIHGYTDRQAVNYSAVVFGQSPSPWTENQPDGTRPGTLRAGHATLTQGETFRWSVDGTIARKVYVRNEDTNAPVRVDVLQIVEATGFHASIADFTTLNK
jgi:hypothetical protein